MAEDQSTLSIFYQGWHDYQELLTKAIVPLSSEQLTLSAAPHLRSIMGDKVSDFLMKRLSA